jgi:NhaP-type Na+/H+ or K+/H+ antiporter
MYAIDQGLPSELAAPFVSLTLTIIAFSILVHGISVTPLLNYYAGLSRRRRRKR